MKIIRYIVILLLIAIYPVSVFAAGSAEYTIDVRNRTGAPVALSYRGVDGVNQDVTLPEGVSSLTITEGVYDYWASPTCGNIAGRMNISQQRQVLWLSCDDATPSLAVTKTDKKGTEFYQTCFPTEGQIYTASDGNNDYEVVLTCSWGISEYNSWVSAYHPGVVWTYDAITQTTSFADWCQNNQFSFTWDYYFDQEGSISQLGPLLLCIY